MRLEWLEAFTVFAEELNFTRAARKLHISQPALHVQISKLGDSMGCRLYSRHGRELRLTVEGKRLEVRAREIVASTTNLPHEISGADVRERVTLCAGEGAYLYLLSNAIRKFSRSSTAQLRLLTGNASTTVEAVAQGRADLGVTVGGQRPSVLEARALTQVGHVAIAPKKHPLARKRAISVNSLHDQDLILPPPGRPLREAVEAEFAKADSTWRLAVEASGWELMIRFVELGFGIAIVNESCGAPGRVKAVPISDLPPVRYDILWRRGSLPKEACRLRDTLLDEGDSWRS